MENITVFVREDLTMAVSLYKKTPCIFLNYFDQNSIWPVIYKFNDYKITLVKVIDYKTHVDGNRGDILQYMQNSIKMLLIIWNLEEKSFVGHY